MLDQVICDVEIDALCLVVASGDAGVVESLADGLAVEAELVGDVSNGAPGFVGGLDRRDVVFCGARDSTWRLEWCGVWLSLGLGRQLTHTLELSWMVRIAQ